MKYELAKQLFDIAQYRAGVGDMYSALCFHREARKHYYRAKVLVWEAQRLLKEEVRA